MIDARAARNDPDEYRRRARAQGRRPRRSTRWLAADERWRELVPRVDELRARTKLKGKPTPEQLEELRGVKEELQRAEARAREARRARDETARAIPNPPDDSAPDGFDRRGRRRAPPRRRAAALAEPKEHTEIGRFDMERAARLSGSRFGYLLGDTALLALALYRFALDTAVEARAHADAAAGARPRGGDVRHRLLPDRALEHLRASRATTST